MDQAVVGFFKNKKVMIIGAAGTVGKEILKQVHSFEVSEIRLFDNNETEMFFLMEEYKNRNVVCFLGDVRDREKVENVATGVDIIIHAAAFKHVILSEYNPFDVVQTNIIGVENVIRAASNCKVANVMFTSSDKAVNPSNVMGASKLMGERLITAANIATASNGTVFSSTRFGNVIGSRGSVIPLFARQIKKGGPVTLTDKRMTRFVMTLEDATMLVLKSIAMSKGGEVFVTKMPVVRIADLAEVMIEALAEKFGHKASDIEVVEIGAKPGEKLYEELMTDSEMGRSLELKDLYVIKPVFLNEFQSKKYEYHGLVSSTVERSYISNNEEPLSKAALKKYLMDNAVLEKAESEIN